MKHRLAALDRLRGLLMVLMAIDHVSYFVANRHPEEFWGLPLPAVESSAAGTAWFFTRFITHFCAPGFFLLMGASQSLFADARAEAGWSDRRVRRYWITRGLLLILLQQFIEDPAWLVGTLDYPSIAPVPGGGGTLMLHFGVLYGLGLSMIAGAFLLRAPTALLSVLAPGSVLLTAALLPDASAVHAAISPFWLLTAVPGHTGVWQVFYPALPWVGVTTCGLLLGRALRWNAGRTLRAAPLVGVLMLVAFVIARSLGGGVGQLLNVVARPGDGLLEWLSIVKYPPAAAFLLVTLGGSLVCLGAFSRLGPGPGSRNGPLMVFGQTALFFYLLHLYLYAAIGLLLPGPHGLVVTYACWAAGLGALYAACRWYRGFKAATAPESLWRLF